MRIFRLNAKRHRATPFGRGGGGALVAGRWNQRGTPVAYASATVSLAFLELFVNVPTITLRSLDREYEIVGADIPDDAIHAVDIAELPRDWRRIPPSASTQSMGTAWIREGKYPVFSVPSAVIERNFLINPNHPELSKITIHPPQSLLPDPRIFARLR